MGPLSHDGGSDIGPANEYTLEDWRQEGAKRFGPDHRDWKFVCPVCGIVTAVHEWIDAGVPECAAFSCIGRQRGGRDAFGGKGKGPCNYAGGGLFRLNPITVLYPDGTKGHAFAFAEPVVTK